MVSYTKYTAIAHDVYKSKGGTYPDGLTTVSSTFGEFWSENKDQLKDASAQNVRNSLNQAITV